MATEYKTLTEIYRDAQHKLADIEEWCKFLTAACRNYRLPFDEQLLIFAQRPDAAAVLPINGKSAVWTMGEQWRERNCCI